MGWRKRPEKKALVCLVIICFLVLIFPEFQYAGPNREPVELRTKGTLTGRILTAGVRMPVSGAVVKIRNLNTQKEFVSAQSDANGNFRITDIDEGWYTVGVTTSGGDFNLTYGVYIKAGESARLIMELKPGGVIDSKGTASGKGFFKTPAGIVVIVLAAGGLAFAVYELTKKEGEVSPVR